MRSLAIVLTCLTVGGTLSATRDARTTPASSAPPPLYGNQDFYWKGSPVTIPTCWENQASVPATRLPWVREAMERQWMRYARVNFTEWDACKSGDAGVHVFIRDTVPSAPGGANLNAVNKGATLNLQWDSAGPGGCRTGDVGRRHCTQSVSLHEFGHVLGFYHEEERPEYVAPPGTPPKAPCDKQTIKNSTPRLYGVYDIGSIMSYCGQPGGNASTWKDSISAGDIAAVQRAYGRRIAGSFVSPRATCLAAHAERADGEGVFMWGCDEAKDDQEWKWDGAYQLFIQTSASGPRRCLQVAQSAGSSATIANCGGVPGQRWSFEAVELRGWGALCLDAPGGATTPGTTLQVWQCGALSGNNQRWSLVNGSVRYGQASSSTCLTMSNPAAVLQPCAPGSAAQLFDFTSAGEIRSRSNGQMCLDVRAVIDQDYRAGKGLPANGAPVQFYSCLPAQYNQKWNVSGNVRAVGTALCLEREGDGSVFGAGARAAQCSGSEAQRWDYYPKAG